MEPQIALFKLGISPFELLPQSPGTCRALQFSERGYQASLYELKSFVPRGAVLDRHISMTQNPFIDVDWHNSTTPSTHRGLLRHADFRKSRGKRHPDVLRHGVRLRERQCHRRMGT
jgi:hypothetical protein